MMSVEITPTGDFTLLGLASMVDTVDPQKRVNDCRRDLGDASPG